jgi:hypothetical protein
MANIEGPLLPPSLIVLCLALLLFIALEQNVLDYVGHLHAQDGLKVGPTLKYENDTTMPLVIERIFSMPNNTDSFLGPNMAFLGPDDILIIDDVSGKVWRIIDGRMSEQPLVDVNSHHQDGLIGIAVAKNQSGAIHVFLYFNEAPSRYGADIEDEKESHEVNKTLGFDREGDRLYRYELVGNNLVYPKLLFSIPDRTTDVLNEMHHGGEVIVGPNDAIYISIGEIEGQANPESRTKAQNYEIGTRPDGRAGIIRLSQEGEPVDKGILGSRYPLNLYYAYGIRNSFGMDFDPITGNLWNTENGPSYGDEINLVKPGFNSGWNKVQGLWRPNGDEKGDLALSPEDLVDFGGKGVYSPPEFIWNFTVGPTALKFLNSDKFGEEFKNDMFVADINNGNIYHFDLNKDRTELSLIGPLEDKIADIPEELEGIIFAQGFPGIVDLQVGPDGYLYIISDKNIFRIRPLNN